MKYSRHVTTVFRTGRNVINTGQENTTRQYDNWLEVSFI